MEAEEQVQENDMMADLSSAFEALNSEDEADDGLAPVSDTSEGPEAELEAEAEVPAEPVPDETGEPVEGDAEAPEPVIADGGDEPPPSLSSQEARDAWKDANPALKEEFKRFDQRLEGMAQKYGQDAQRAQSMDKALQPYQQLFMANGGQPGQVISNVLQAASQLQFGTPMQKAQTWIAMAQQFGVDINTAADLMEGNAPNPQAQTQEQIQQAIQQERQRWQQEQQQREQQNMQQRTQGELQQFMSDPANPYAKEVGREMAVALQLAAERGEEMTLKQAYDEACRINPQVASRIASQRSKQELQQRQSAATSITGSPGGSGETGPKTDDIRGALEHAIETAGRV